MKKIIAIAAVALLTTSCAKSSSMPLTKSMAQITSIVTPPCDAEGAHKVANERAAVETLKYGYQRFVIVNYNPIAGDPPGNSTSMPSAHSQELTVKMFNPGEKGYREAISAKDVLGQDWEDALNQTKFDCLGI